jgi:hypothetical protein
MELDDLEEDGLTAEELAACLPDWDALDGKELREAVEALFFELRDPLSPQQQRLLRRAGELAADCRDARARLAGRVVQVEALALESRDALEAARDCLRRSLPKLPGRRGRARRWQGSTRPW